MIRKYQIGRSPENQIVLNYPMISSYHADLIVNTTESGKQITLVDHSTNGTYINGQKLNNASCYIAYGDLVVFPGNIMFDWNLLEDSNFQMPSQATILCTSDYLRGQDGEYRDSGNTSEEQDITFVGALKKFFTHYLDFSGRSRRKELWFIILWNMIFLSAISLISIPCIINYEEGGLVIFSILCALYTLVIFIPMLALYIRRIHDVGESGWFYLFTFVPVANFVFCCIWLFKDSEYRTNKWGKCPKKIY